MKILTLGDIVSPYAVEYLEKNLWDFRKENGIDFVVANGENASEGNGITKDDAKRILSSGVDVITGGNHTFKKNSIHSLLEDDERIIRPHNYPKNTPGSGYTIVECQGYRILVMNVLGVINMEPLADPFESIENILSREKGAYDFSILDVHAETTSEKLAIAYSFDGKISVIFGTHTHVATADLRILKNKTGYITDLGYCGPHDSILGVKKEIIIKRMRTHMLQKFEFSEDNVYCEGAIFDLSENTFMAEKAERVEF